MSTVNMTLDSCDGESKVSVRCSFCAHARAFPCFSFLCSLSFPYNFSVFLIYPLVFHLSVSLSFPLSFLDSPQWDVGTRAGKKRISRSVTCYFVPSIPSDTHVLSSAPLCIRNCYVFFVLCTSKWCCFTFFSLLTLEETLRSRGCKTCSKYSRPK